MEELDVLSGSSTDIPRGGQIITTTSIRKQTEGTGKIRRYGKVNEWISLHMISIHVSISLSYLTLLFHRILILWHLVHVWLYCMCTYMYILCHMLSGKVQMFGFLYDCFAGIAQFLTCHKYGNCRKNKKKEAVKTWLEPYQSRMLTQFRYLMEVFKMPWYSTMIWNALNSIGYINVIILFTMCDKA